jgi:hypothetical protein
MAIHLSKDRFASTPKGHLISWGIIENSPDGVYMTSEGGTLPLLWTAWKGRGDDWAIYVTAGILIQNVLESSWWEALKYCHDHGDKVHSKDLIARMIDADPEVLKRYRR